MGESNILISIKDLTKRYGDVLAVDHVSFDIKRGVIKGLIGENGSGKSTISSMLAGLTSITSGEVILNGNPFVPQDVLNTRKNGIAMIVQETGTIDHLSVAQNIFLGEENLFAKFGVVSKSKMNKAAREALKAVNLDIDVSLPTCMYNFETRKLIEVAKALYYKPDLFIVDETTTALSQAGRKTIQDLIRRLKNENKAVLFISHDIDELIEYCDELTILRDGKLIKNISKDNKTEFVPSFIKKSMVGRDIKDNYYRTDYGTPIGSKEVISVNHVNGYGLNDVSFTLHENEILGIGGLSGSGMHEIGRMLFGMDKPEFGDVYKVDNEGNKHDIKSIKDALNCSIGYISKDRDKETLIMNETIKENLSISALNLLDKFTFISPKKEKKFASDLIDSFNIKCSSPNQKVKELSGGNKQKVSFSKWIGNKSTILVFDSPTRGVDIGVKATMYQLMYDLRRTGYSIVIISEELPELIGMSDNLLIMKDGKITKELKRSKDLNEQKVIEFMI